MGMEREGDTPPKEYSNYAPEVPRVGGYRSGRSLYRIYFPRALGLYTPYRWDDCKSTIFK